VVVAVVVVVVEEVEVFGTAPSRARAEGVELLPPDTSITSKTAMAAAIPPAIPALFKAIWFCRSMPSPTKRLIE